MFIVRTFVTRPAGTAWYKHNSALGTQTIGQWVATQSGVLRNRTRRLGKNRRVNTMTFADQASYEAFKAALDATPQYQDKQAYFANNGFVVVTKKYQEVQ